MKNLLRRQIANYFTLGFALVFWGVPANAVTQSHYENPAFGVHWQHPQGWVRNDESDGDLVRFQKPSHSASVALKAFATDPQLPIKMDELKAAMAAAYYDGWEIIATRDASETELLASGALEQARILYRKRLLQWDASDQRILLLEHYFLGHNYAFVITCQIPEHQWTEVSQELLEFLAGFSINSPADPLKII